MQGYFQPQLSFFSEASNSQVWALCILHGPCSLLLDIQPDIWLHQKLHYHLHWVPQLIRIILHHKHSHCWLLPHFALPANFPTTWFYYLAAAETSKKYHRLSWAKLPVITGQIENQQDQPKKTLSTVDCVIPSVQIFWNNGCFSYYWSSVFNLDVQLVKSCKIC